MAPETTTEATKAKETADETKAAKQDQADAIAEIKAEREGTDKAAVAARIAVKAKARADALAMRQMEAGDVQSPNVPVAGDSDLEAALKALGAEVDRAGAKLLAGASPAHETTIAAAVAFHPVRPNDPSFYGRGSITGSAPISSGTSTRQLADGTIVQPGDPRYGATPVVQVAPVSTPAKLGKPWDGVSTEDRINYEVDRLAGLRRALNPVVVTPAQMENTADAHRAQAARDEARTPEQKKAAAEAAQKVADAAAAKSVGPTKVKAKAMFITDIGTKVSKGDVITLEGAELNRRITNGEVTKDLS